MDLWAKFDDSMSSHSRVIGAVHFVMIYERQATQTIATGGNVTTVALRLKILSLNCRLILKAFDRFGKFKLFLTSPIWLCQMDIESILNVSIFV